MKRFVILLLLCTLLLSGCGSIYSNYREVEQLLVIETMGFDYVPGGVHLTLSSGMGSGSSQEPVHLEGTGQSVSAAMDQARNYSFEDELFCSQTNSILIGEEAARQGIEGYLSYICQSPMLRTDVPVFIVKGGSARDSIMSTGDSQHGVSEILQGVTEYLETRGGSHIIKASELVRSSLRHGSALCCVLEYSESMEPPAEQSKGASGNQTGSSDSAAAPVQDKNPSRQQGGGEQNQASASGQDQQSGREQSQQGGGENAAKTLAVSGFGVLRDNKLIHYIDKDLAVGVSFLINKVGISIVELTDVQGKPVVLELNQGGSTIRPRWDSKGELSGLDIHVDVKATVTEMNDGANLSSESYTRQLTTQLETHMGEQLGEILRLAARLEADFLSLGAIVEQADPLLYRHMERSFAETLPALEFRVSVKGELSHTNDMKESLT